MTYRDTVAAAVDRAVREFTGTDGACQCAWYAIAGWRLLGQLHPQHGYQIQVGSLTLCCDPERGLGVTIDATAGGLDRLEFHAWLGRCERVDDGRDGVARRGLEFVDFSARHHRMLAEWTQGNESVADVGGALVVRRSPTAPRARWTIAEPPPYIWAGPEGPPDWCRYVPDADATLAFLHRLHDDRDAVLRIGQLASRHYLSIQRTNDLNAAVAGSRP